MLSFIYDKYIGIRTGIKVQHFSPVTYRILQETRLESQVRLAEIRELEGQRLSPILADKNSEEIKKLLKPSF